MESWAKENAGKLAALLSDPDVVPPGLVTVWVNAPETDTRAAEAGMLPSFSEQEWPQAELLWAPAAWNERSALVNDILHESLAINVPEVVQLDARSINHGQWLLYEDRVDHPGALSRALLELALPVLRLRVLESE